MANGYMEYRKFCQTSTAEFFAKKFTPKSR